MSFCQMPWRMDTEVLAAVIRVLERVPLLTILWLCLSHFWGSFKKTDTFSAWCSPGVWCPLLRLPHSSLCLLVATNYSKVLTHCRYPFLITKVIKVLFIKNIQKRISRGLLGGKVGTQFMFLFFNNTKRLLYPKTFSQLFQLSFGIILWDNMFSGYRSKVVQIIMLIKP